MEISVFEIIGPIMMGPSSSGTAGMARLGNVAREFIDEPIKSIDLKFCPQFGEEYYSCKSHQALIGGLLGISVYDTNLKNAVLLAREQGIELTQSFFEKPLPDHPLSVKISVLLQSGEIFEFTGASIGGGSIRVENIDGFSVNPNNMKSNLFVWSNQNIRDELRSKLPDGEINCSGKDGCYLYYIGVDGFVPPEQFLNIKGVTKAKFLQPFIKYGSTGRAPLFTSFESLVEMSERTNESIAELTIEYEINRSGHTREDIWNTMRERLCVMKSAVRNGIKGIPSLCGFNSGYSGKQLMDAVDTGKTMGGTILPKAIARALAVMEVSLSMGVIVATPTGGSAGIIPGILTTLQEARNISEEKLIETLFVCAAVGIICFYHESTFSGSAGGCQAEIGISSGMAAAGIAYLGGGSAKQIANAAALAIKNILGLICDPIRGSCEVPCVKRNGIGVANAFTAADMALAGIESYIPVDEVIDSLVIIQRHLPQQMRCGSLGVPSTPTGKKAAEMTRQIFKDEILPIIHSGQ